ncbi:MAG: hypothetical protein ACI32N_04345 [Bulleidia sp.]
MSNILGIFGILLYMSAPFFSDTKRAFYARLLGELMFGLMFFYIGCLAGVVYYLVMIVSAVFEKQIEHNRIFSFVFGLAGCAAVILLNNNGTPGIILGLSLILIYLHVDEQKMLTTSAFMDVATAVILLYYSISVSSIAAIVFAVIMIVIAMAGLFSAVRLVKGGGLQAAAAEEELYQRSRQTNRNRIKAGKKAKTIASEKKKK